MTTIYEYRFNHLLIDVGELGRLDAPEQQEKLAETLDNLAVGLSQSLMELDGGRFEAVSHNFVIIGEKILVTVLVRCAIGDQHIPRFTPGG